MFQVARLQGLTASELLALTVKDLGRKRADFTFLRNWPGNAVRTLQLLPSYLRQVRPLFIGTDGSALFLTLEADRSRALHLACDSKRHYSQRSFSTNP